LSGIAWTREHRRRFSRQVAEAHRAGKYAHRLDWNGGHPANWRGGRKTHHGGYALVSAPTHPYADSQGYVREHRLVMEDHLGRVLLPTEIVHHINGDTADNRIKNLILFDSLVGHLKHHREQRRKPCA